MPNVQCSSCSATQSCRGKWGRDRHEAGGTGQERRPEESGAGHSGHRGRPLTAFVRHHEQYTDKWSPKVPCVLCGTAAGLSRLGRPSPSAHLSKVAPCAPGGHAPFSLCSLLLLFSAASYFSCFWKQKDNIFKQIVLQGLLGLLTILCILPSSPKYVGWFKHLLPGLQMTE